MSLEPTDPDPIPIPPVVPEPAAPITPVSTAIDCPGCGAKVHAVLSDAGAKIHCLNCGARFTPLLSADSTLAEPSVTRTLDEETPPPIQEPRSAGYWFLRIPAMLYFGGMTLLSLFYASIILFTVIFERRSTSFNALLMGMIHLPLMPISGYYAFVVTRALARLEAHTLKAAWNEKLIQSAPPPVRGSSLPYIVPLAVAPVSIFIILVVKSMRSFDNFDPFDYSMTFLAGIAGVICFPLAFMADDFRQFTWRQKSIVDMFTRPDGTSKVTEKPSRFPWLGVFPALTVLSFALALASIALGEYNRGWSISWRRYQPPVMFSLALAISSLTLFLTGRNFKHVVVAWRHASEIDPNLPDAPSRRVRLALGVFASVGTITLTTLFYQIYQNNNSDWEFIFPVAFALTLSTAAIALYRKILPRKPPIAVTSSDRIAVSGLTVLVVVMIFLLWTDFWIHSGSFKRFETMSFFFMVLGANFICLTQGQIYADVRRWRLAQTSFWISRQFLTAPTELPKTPFLIFRGTLVLVAIQACVLTASIWNTFTRSWGPSGFELAQITAMPLLVFMASFPTIWVALVSREFLLAEETAAQARAATDARLAALNYS